MRIKQLTLTLVMVLSSLFCLTVNAQAQAIMDAPHDDDVGMGCLTCHDVTAFDQPSMIPGGSEAVFVAICQGCHVAPAMETHYGTTYGGWSVGCSVCHNQHIQESGPLHSFIRKSIDLSKIAITPAKSGTKPVVFDGTPATYADGAGAVDGICEVCHTQTSHFLNDGTLSGVGVHAGLEGTDCLACHSHDGADGAFKASCELCHAAPPVTAPADLVSDSKDGPATTGSTIAGAHAEHSTNQGIGCSSCHYDNQAASHDDGTPLVVTIGFGTQAPILQGGHYDGQAGVQYDATATTPATTVTTPGTDAKECSNIYCHGNYAGSGLNSSPKWDTPATAACSTCHGASNTIGSTPASGSHTKHAQAGPPGSMNRGYECTLCHTGIAGGTGPASYSISDNTKHVNGYVEWEYDVTDSRLTSDSIYNTPSGTVTPSDGSGPNRLYSTCNNVYCHSIVQTDSGGALTADTANYKTPTWGSSVTCGGCHESDGGSHMAGTMSTGSHSGHLAYRFTTTMPGMKCELCHRMGTATITSNSDCSSCHANGERTDHVDGEVDIVFETTYVGNTGTYNGTPAPGDGYGTCSSIYCHSNAQPDGGIGDPDTFASPTWGGESTTCGSCHKSGVHNDTGSLIDSGSHTEHLAYGFNSSDTPKCTICHTMRSAGLGNFNCENCHGVHGPDGLLDAVHDVHVDGNVTLIFETTFGSSTSYSGTPAPGDSYGNCATSYCHGNGTSVSTGTINANTSPAWGTPGPLACDSCHDNGPAYANNSPKANSHGEHISAGYGCEDCHFATTTTGNTITDKTKHVNNSYDVTPDTGAGITFTYTYVPGGNSTCSTVSCHGGTWTAYWGHTHDVAYNSVVDISQISNPSQPQPCGHCHDGNDADGNGTPLNSWVDILSEHVTGCARCHEYTDDGQGTPTEAEVTAALADAGVTCVTCHVKKDKAVDVANVTTDSDHGGHDDVDFKWNSQCSVCHDSSNSMTGVDPVISGVHSNGCILCHDTAAGGDGTAKVGDNFKGDATKGDTTTPHLSDCLVCHKSGSNESHGLAAATVGGVHNISSDSSGGYACSACHTDMATGSAQLIKHMVTPTAGTVQNDCYRCHVPSFYNAAVADDPAMTVIATATAPATNLAVTCESCHVAKGDYLRHGLADSGGDTVADAHDQLANQVGTTSTCSSASCHNTSTDAERLLLHTGAGTTCLTCHQYAAPVSTVIAAGWAATPSPAECQECHTVLGGNWYAHVVDHTASGMNAVLPEPAGASRTVSCSSTNCHAAQGDIITGVHDIYAPTGGSEPCKECHNAGGTLITGNDGYGDATSGSGGGAKCSTCHTAAYFDTHLHDHSTTVTFVAGTDLSQAAPGTACNECHGVGASSPYSLANWSDKLYEHDFVNAPQDGTGACTSCHDYDTRTNQTGDANTPVTATVTGVIDNNTSVTCIGCHTGKVQPNTHGYYDHATDGGLGYAPITKTGNCTDNCHSGEVVVTVHKNLCSTCHTTAPTLKSTPDLAQFAGTTTTCINCHNDGLDLDDVGPYKYHGISYAHSETLTRHNNLSNSDSSMIYDCQACHTDMSTATLKLQKHMATDTVADCYRCHYPSVWGALSDTPAQTAITNGKGAGSAQTCEDCHVNKGDYLLHGMTSTTANDVHDKLVVDAACSACHTSATDINRLELHTNPLNIANSGDCLTCHTAAGGAATVITNGQGASGTDQACQACHAAKGTYSLHGLTSGTVFDVHNALGSSTGSAGTEQNCAECHTAASVLARINLHANCATCHSEATAPATTVIANGWKTVSPDLANCESCHVAKGNYLRHGLTDDNGADGVVDVHDQLSTQSGTATSVCVNCHLNKPLDSTLKRLQVHTRAAVTPTTCLTCHQSGTPVSTVIADGWGSANAAQCDECHTAIGADWYAHNIDHTGRVGGDGVCTNCHGNPTVAPSVARDAKATPYIVSGDVHEGGCSICHDADGTPVAMPAAKAQVFTAGVCTDCHTDAWVFIHPGVDHTAIVLPDSACTTCHAASTPNSDATEAINTPYVGSSTEVHYEPVAGDGCRECHTATGPLRVVPTPTRFDQIVRGGTCITCHMNTTNWVERHQNVIAIIDHSLRVDETTDSTCETCHTTTGGNAEITLDSASPAGDKVHDECISCHDAADGSLVNSAAGNGGGADCATCHTAGYFPSHVHGLDGGYVNHLITHQTGVDVGQGGAECNTCHSDSNKDATGANFSSWTDINWKHGNNDCVTCHSYVDNGTPTKTISDGVISAGVASSCVDCHTHKEENAPDPSHGGHALTDFAWDVTTESSCGTVDCHDAATNTNVVSDVHNGRFVSSGGVANNCQNCHLNEGGGLPMQTVGPTDGDADPGNAGSNLASICTVCHTASITAIHHETTLNPTTDNTAQAGVCVTCHKPDVGRGPEDETGLAMTTALSAGNGLPCGWCHLYWGGGNTETDGYTVTSSKVQIYQLGWDPDNVLFTPGDAATRTAIASHAVSENGTTPISNFAACFACHGATAATDANGKQVRPFHGFGQPYTGDTGTAVQDTNQIQIYAGPTNPSRNGPMHTESRHPGFNALNTLGAFMPMNKVSGSPGGKSYYGGKSGANIYNSDNTQHTTGTYSTKIEIPWDNYSGGATVGTPVNITNFDLGGISGTQTIPFAVPEIPLDLP